MKKILITGVSGFVGSFLAEYLLKKGKYEIFGTTLSRGDSPNLNRIKDALQLIEINLLDTNAVEKMIKEVKPDEIFHLAALASPGVSFQNPVETISNNINAQINLLESVKKNNLISTKILIISSADIYGIVDKKDLPIDENTPFKPTSPYAVSKIAQDFLGLQYFLAHKLSIVRVRPFNHIGPKQSPLFVVARFAKEIAEIEKGKREPVLKVGNLSARRDFTDVSDTVRAYDLILQKGVYGDVYNIGSGKSYSIKEILDLLLSFVKVRITLEKDVSLFRPADNPELICNAKKLEKITGWKPTIPIEKTLRSTLDYWREIV